MRVVVIRDIVVNWRLDAKNDENIVVLAYGATIKGLAITGSNISIVGGNIEALDGAEGFAERGYAVNLRNASNIRLSGCTIRNADRGVVIDNCDGITVDNCDFAVRQDGIIANQGRNYQFTANRFTNFYPKPTTCCIGLEVQSGLSRRECEFLGGIWTDGDHSDAIQIRNGIKGLVIAGNQIDGIQQGIGQMDGNTDLPLEDVIILANTVRVTGFHSITVPRCRNLQVIGNTTQQLTGRRSPLRLDASAIVKENNVLSP